MIPLLVAVFPALPEPPHETQPRKKMPVIIHGAHTTRSDIVVWACKELQVDYTFHAINWDAKEHKSPEFLAKNPLGQLPAFEDGDLRLTESGAIVLYLAETFGAGGPFAADSVLKRVELVKWARGSPTPE